MELGEQKLRGACHGPAAQEHAGSDADAVSAWESPQRPLPASHMPGSPAPGSPAAPGMPAPGMGRPPGGSCTVPAGAAGAGAAPAPAVSSWAMMVGPRGMGSGGACGRQGGPRGGNAMQHWRASWMRLQHALECNKAGARVQASEAR